jgi:hypothetical protein
MIPDELTRRFHHSQVRKNQSNQDYVSIDGYINRLNEVLGHKWAWSVNHWEFRDGPPTAKGKPQYIAVVSGTLMVMLDDIGVVSVDGDGGGYLTSQRGLISRDGIGAGFNFDPDTSVKTAQAEALKKACHQFGIALYLWSEDERGYVELQRKAMTDDLSLKRLVMEYVNDNMGLDPDEQPQREDIVKCLGIEDLSVENMRAVLIDRGVL